MPATDDFSVAKPIRRPIVLVLMGVSGCGKTTVAAIVAGQLGWPFAEGDALHPQANIDKMFVYLHGSHATIAERLTARHGHYMPPSLLESQFADLQEPAANEPAIKIDVGPAPADIATTILIKLGLDPKP